MSPKLLVGIIVADTESFLYVQNEQGSADEGSIGKAIRSYPSLIDDGSIRCKALIIRQKWQRPEAEPY